MTKKFTPIVFIGKKRFEFKKSFTTKTQALKVAEKTAKQLVSLDKITKQKLFGKTRTITTGFNVQ